MSDFMSDYVLYHSYYEIPRNYVYWSAIATVGAVVNRKVHFRHGDIVIHGNLYVMLVGPQGNGKTTACDFAKRFFKLACPDYAIGASTQSAEDIVSTMAKDDFARTITDDLGNPVIIRAYAFFMNEFKNFIAYSPSRMLAFLTDIYDRVDSFDSSTIKRGVESITNPSLNILACENPDWLINNLKNDIVSGGFSRRIIYVYELDRAEPRAFIDLDAKAVDARDRIVAALSQAKTLRGQFKWAESGRKWYKPWYEHKQRNLPSNALMAGYLGTKHIQLFKTAMALDSVSSKPMLLFTDDLLELAVSFLDLLEGNMPRLSQAAGRNELASAQQKVLEAILQHGGWMLETDAKRLIEVDCNWSETSAILRHLEETEQLVRTMWKLPGAKGDKWMLFLPGVKERLQKEGVIKKADNENQNQKT
jgi:hypothetical protein